MSDLSLVPMKELIAEIERRREHYVFGYITKIDGGEEVVNTFWAGKHCIKEAGLASILYNDVLNNFNDARADDIDY